MGMHTKLPDGHHKFNLLLFRTYDDRISLLSHKYGAHYTHQQIYITLCINRATGFMHFNSDGLRTKTNFHDYTNAPQAERICRIQYQITPLLSQLQSTCSSSSAWVHTTTHHLETTRTWGSQTFSPHPREKIIVQLKHICTSLNAFLRKEVDPLLTMPVSERPRVQT